MKMRRLWMPARASVARIAPRPVHGIACVCITDRRVQPLDDERIEPQFVARDLRWAQVELIESESCPVGPAQVDLSHLEAAAPRE